MSITETCMIEVDPALVMSTGLSDVHKTRELCSDFFSREQEKESTYCQLPGLDLPYIYIAMMSGVPEVELEKGIPTSDTSAASNNNKDISSNNNYNNNKRSEYDRKKFDRHQNTSPRRDRHNYHQSGNYHQRGNQNMRGNRHALDGVTRQPPSNPFMPPSSLQQPEYINPANRTISLGSSGLAHLYHPQHQHQHQHQEFSFRNGGMYKESHFQVTGDLYQSPTPPHFKATGNTSGVMEPKYSPMMSRPGDNKRNLYYPSPPKNVSFRNSPPIMRKTSDFYPDPSHVANYNTGLPFPPNYKQTKFFILTSTVEENIFQSVRYGVWSSTSRGNKTLESAYGDNFNLLLFFGSARQDFMYGVAEMRSHVDFDCYTRLWHDENWKGKFHIKWFYLKNVPKTVLANISEMNNPFKLCRDSTEIPWDVARKALEIFKTYHTHESLLDRSDEFRHRILHKTLAI